MILEDDFDKEKIPKWGRFAVYEFRPKGEPLFSYHIDSRPAEKGEGGLLAGVYYRPLGIIINVKRMFSSKHRYVYIGAVPDF